MLCGAVFELLLFVQVEFGRLQRQEQIDRKAIKAAGRVPPERKYTNDKRPKPQSDPETAVRGNWEELRAMQDAAKAKKKKKKLKPARLAPASPVSSSGGRPGGTNPEHQSSSSSDSPQHRSLDSSLQPNAHVVAPKVPTSKTAKARLFKSRQSSPDADNAATDAAITDKMQQVGQQQPDSKQLPETAAHQPQEQQQQQEQQQLQEQLPPEQQQIEAPPTQLHQQSGMQQLLKAFGPLTLRDSMFEDLLKDAPPNTALPQPAKDFFKRLVTQTLDVSLEKRTFKHMLQQAGDQLQVVQDRVEYQAEEMMDLQSQVRNISL